MAENDLILYTTDDGDARFVLRELGGQVWLTQLEMAKEAVINPKFTTAISGNKRHCPIKSHALAVTASDQAVSSIDGYRKLAHHCRTTHPLQGHLVGCCLGRKNRPLGGFFISATLTLLALSHYTSFNTAATPLNNAQPWRLFLCLGFGGYRG